MISTTLITLATLFMTSSPLVSAVPVTLVGRADGALSCYPLTIDQARQLPGWKKIEQYAKDNWGEGGVNVVTNPSEYPDRGANACMNHGRVPVQFSEQPACSTTKSVVEGKVEGTSQKVTFKETIGHDTTSSWTVTRSSSLTTGMKFSVSIGIPSIGVDVGAETYMETTVTDERSTSFETKGSTMRDTTLEFENKDGDSCQMTLETQTCRAGARGRAPIMGTGVVWFNYDDKRAPIINPHNDGEHYKYAAFIDDILTPEERTMYIEFQGPVNSVSKSGYSTNCKQTK